MGTIISEPTAAAVIKTEESSTADTPQTDDLTNTESVTVKDEITAEFDTFGDGKAYVNDKYMFLVLSFLSLAWTLTHIVVYT